MKGVVSRVVRLWAGVLEDWAAEGVSLHPCILNARVLFFFASFVSDLLLDIGVVRLCLHHTYRETRWREGSVHEELRRAMAIIH